MKSRIWAVLALLAAFATTASLGAWQLRRGAEKDALQAQREAARAAEAIVPGGAPDALVALDGRRVALRGRFVEERTVFLDNRTRGGVAGFHVLTPLRTDAGAWHIVLRGWVARDVADRTRLPVLPAAPPEVRLEGFAQASLAQPMLLAAPSEPEASERLWQHYDPATYRRWSGLPVTDGLVRQISDLPDGLVRDWVEPGSGADKHRAYAFQWFAMAAGLAIAIGVIVVRSRTSASRPRP